MSYRGTGNGAQNNGPRRGNRTPRQFKNIDRWEEIETIVKRSRDAGKSHLSLEVILERPIFEDGTKGYFRLSTRLVVNHRDVLRLPMSALLSLVSFILSERDRILNTIDQVRRRNDEIDYTFEEEEARRNRRYISHEYQDRFVGLDNESGESNPPDEEEPVEDEDPEETEKPYYPEYPEEELPEKPEPPQAQSEPTEPRAASLVDSASPRRTRRRFSY